MLLALCGFLLWEFKFPKAESQIIDTKRQLTNFFLYIFVLIIQWLFVELDKMQLIASTLLADLSVFDHFVNFDNSRTNLARISLFVTVFLIIDLLYYGLHRLFHRYQKLWCWHLVHHSDKQLDISTNFRHHPIEVLLMSIILLVLFLFFPIDSQILLAYTCAAFVIQVWHHSNISINSRLDQYLRLVVVTPSVHHIHHSPEKIQTNSNYGAIFTFWDRLFASYYSPNLQIEQGDYGLEYFRASRDGSLIRLLMQPIDYLMGRTK